MLDHLFGSDCHDNYNLITIGLQDDFDDDNNDCDLQYNNNTNIDNMTRITMII